MLFLKYIGITPLYFILTLVVPFYMLFSWKNRLAIESYLKRMGYSSRWVIFRRTWLNHYYFAQAMVDRFALLSGLQNRYKVSISGNEALIEVLHNNKGAIIAGAHVGNMELAGYFFEHQQKRFNGVVFAEEAKFITKHRIKELEKHQVNMIPVTSDMSHLFFLHQALEQGECLTLHCDRNLLGKKQVEVTFLGEKTLFPKGAFQLAVRMDVPLLAMFMMRQKSKCYHLIIQNLTNQLPEGGADNEKINGYINLYVSLLEEVLKKYPEQWYNYFDFWNVA